MRDTTIHLEIRAQLAEVGFLLFVGSAGLTLRFCCDDVFRVTNAFGDIDALDRKSVV
jgi:hypothetical protein